MIAAIARRLQPLRRDRRGASAAEFGLTLPLWIILIFAVFNIGRFYWARAGLQNGLGEAARTATLWPSRDVATIRSSFNARTATPADVPSAPAVPLCLPPLSCCAAPSFCEPNGRFLVTVPTRRRNIRSTPLVGLR